VHVLHAHPRTFPMVSGEHDFAVISTGIARGRVDNEKAELAGIRAAIEVSHRHGVAVVPPRARGFGREAVKQRFPGRDDRRTLFHGAVLQGWDEQSMPVDQVGIAGIIDNLDGYRHAFL
jgi:hypothetical protein